MLESALTPRLQAAETRESLKNFRERHKRFAVANVNILRYVTGMMCSEEPGCRLCRLCSWSYDYL